MNSWACQAISKSSELSWIYCIPVPVAVRLASYLNFRKISLLARPWLIKALSSNYLFNILIFCISNYICCFSFSISSRSCASFLWSVLIDLPLCLMSSFILLSYCLSALFFLERSSILANIMSIFLTSLRRRTFSSSISLWSSMNSPATFYCCI